MSSEKIKTAE